MVDIGTFGGTFGQPNGMNNRGQVVGFSNIAGDQLSHAFRWDKKRGLKDLGLLPGGMFGGANAINDAGEVVGGSDSPNGFFAVLWKDGGITNLGTVAGDTCSWANWINSQGQIVGNGSACGREGDHAFLWENGGPVVDLQSLVQTGSGVTLGEALFINDRGEIAARGYLPSGVQHAVLLIPCDENHAGVEGCDYDLVDAATAARPSPAPAIQPPAALTPSSHMPGMLNRFRFPRGQRATGFGTLPTPEAKQALPANTDSNYLEADHRLGQQLAPRQFGYCMVSNGLINGTCSKYNYYSCLAKPSTYCPRGQKAKKPGYFRCSNTRQTFVDLGRGCFF
jgi:probable HAF family extracellular repeat protein